jgi:hypothetical protein
LIVMFSPFTCYVSQPIECTELRMAHRFVLLHVASSLLEIEFI